MADAVDKNYRNLESNIDKLTLNQCSIIKKFDALSKNVDEMRKILAQFSEKMVALEEVASDKRKFKVDIKVLRNRIDELYDIVKEGKEEGSAPSDDVRDVESCHSGFSCSSKVTMTTGLDRDTIRSAYEDVRSDGSPTEWKCSASNRLIHAKDHASVQLVIADVDPATGRAGDASKMYVACGAIRRMGESDDCIVSITKKDGILA